MSMKTRAEGREGDSRFCVRAASQASAAPASGGTGLSRRRGVPLSVPLPFLLTGACAAALFALLAPWLLPLALQAPEFPRCLLWFTWSRWAG